MTDPITHPRYPLRVRGELTEPLSRWLWLVKWLILIPHLLVLALLWVAYAVVTVIAFFAILVTGRYPHGLFSFNLGVLRWTWRVGYYGYAALGTDRYPPFTLGAVPDYPATLDLDYPAQLSRGLVLIKWWLLALPHFLILAALAGTATLATNDSSGAGSLSVLALAVLFAGVGLLFRNRYPPGLFDLVMGVNRWALRVAVYTTLMTDVYPPFRLDQGGNDVGVVEPTPETPASIAGAGAAATGSPAGRFVALVAGVLLILPALALTAVGGTGVWLNGQRDAAGFISTPTQSISSSAGAVTIENVHLDIDRSTGIFLSSNDLGQLRIRVASDDGSPVFVGIAPQKAVDRWLAGRAHDEITNIDAGNLKYQHHSGTLSVNPPGGQQFWSASAAGPGAQELRWKVTSGTWSLVTARSDGAGGLHLRAAVAAKIPSLAGLAVGLLIAGIMLVSVGVALIAWGAAGLGRHAHRAGLPPGPGAGPGAGQLPSSQGSPVL